MLKFFKGALLLFVAATLTQCKKDEEKTPTQTTDNTTSNATPKNFQLEKTELGVKVGQTATVKLLNGKGPYKLEDNSPYAELLLNGDNLTVKAKNFPARFSFGITDKTLGQTLTLTVCVTAFSPTDYQLSPDGTTLLKWNNTAQTIVDMNTDLALSKITTIAENAFANSQATLLFLPKTLKNIQKGAFASSKITSLSLEETALVSLGEETFKDCQSLDRVSLPSTLKQIGSSAFSGCKNLAGITLPDSLTVLEQSVFEGTALANVQIPEAVTTIKAKAFKGTKLQSLSLKATTPPVLEATNAIPFNIRYIRVPQQSEQAYREAENWSSFANVINPNED